MLLGSFLAPSVYGQTVVTFSTPLGDFNIQLLDELTPISANNFINYVVTGRYDTTIVHRTEPGFVIQGGGYTFDDQEIATNPIDVDDAILNERLVSNTRGTVALAKLANDPNSGTSQWFINLADNTFLDNSNGGFTVFGIVTGDGMTVVDQIANLPAQQVLNLNFNVPLIDYSGGALAASNLVTIEAEITDSHSPNTYNATTDRLNFRIDAGALGQIGLSFVIESQSPEVVIRALPETLIPLSFSQSSFATFDVATEELIVPQLVIDGSVAYQNVKLQLTDSEQLLFTLISAE